MNMTVEVQFLAVSYIHLLPGKSELLLQATSILRGSKQNSFTLSVHSGFNYFKC